MALKPLEDVTACVVDYGSFISVAEKLAETMKKVYYHSPYDTEFQDIRHCVKGSGLDRVKRLDEFLDPAAVDEIDLWVFPDIGYTDVQRLLRASGKPVWGHMGGTDLELYRSTFLETIDGLGLPVILSNIIVGLSNLAAFLKENDHKWVKIDRYRANMETWHHIDYAHSQRMLESLAVVFGAAKEQIVFVVQDEIDADLELGYDGWCVDGRFPSHSFQGYEKKNELYLGSVLSNHDLPDELKIINEKMAPELRELGYRCWWATEVRIKNGMPFFIDPTARMPGQTGEHQLETITNFADVVWHGANGDLIEPKFEWKFAAEATLHFDLKARDEDAIGSEWITLDVPKSVLRWVKMYHYCKIDGLYHIPEAPQGEVGVVIGVGDSTEKAIADLMKHLKALKGLPIHAEVADFAGLLDCLQEAEKQGVKFGGRVPTPESIVRRNVDLI
jgi:hypothetical protein